MALSLALPSSRKGQGVLAAVAAVVVVWAGSRVLALRRRRHKDAIRRKKQQECRNNIQAVAATVTMDTEAQRLKDIVTKLSAKELVEEIKEGKLTAVQVLHAFQAKALEAHEATNCVCWFFPEAEEQARAADAKPKKEGLLFGLPISVKDHFSIKGHDSTFGIADCCFHPYEQDCLVIETLKNHGAIPFVRTNIPQLMLSFECGNPIFGYTTNPHDQTRGPGGSSGGEGALVGFGGSPLGIGSDIGGSIRMPCSVCGVYGFKPSVLRVSKRYMPRYDDGQLLIDETYGPMAPSMDAIILTMQCLWDGQMAENDLKVLPLSFNHDVYENNTPLIIGYYEELDTFPAVPPMRRGVRVAVEALRARGHKVIEWMPPNPKEAVVLEFEALEAHGGASWLQDLKDDVLDASIQNLVGDLQMPKWFRKLKNGLLTLFMDPLSARLMNAQLGINSVEEYWKKTEEVMIQKYNIEHLANTCIRDYRDAVSDSWVAAGLDVVIGPVFPIPALPKYRTYNVPTEKLYLECGASYTMLYNTLDLPAGTVPVSTITQQDLHNMDSYPKHSPLLQAVHKGMRGAEGLPVCVQVISQRYRDELALRVMKELETALKPSKPV